MEHHNEPGLPRWDVSLTQQAKDLPTELLLTLIGFEPVAQIPMKLAKFWRNRTSNEIKELTS